MLIQIHILQNYAPANLNRDDSGSPKDAMFGGKLRGRISSQCLKRSIRLSATFADAFAADGLLGVRTRTLPSLIQDELVALGASTEELEAIVRRVPEIGRESTKRKTQEAGGAAQVSSEESESETATKQLIFLNRRELRPLAEGLLARFREAGAKGWGKLEIKDIAKALPGGLPRSVDIAMFGRMTTSDAFEDVQAAVQVAHALSTNALTQEFDYYTAVDDLSDEPGAGMIGDVEYNSSAYYKYANVHWEQLVHNLGGDAAVARRAVLALVEAAATAQPTGKQNTFAAHSLPDLVLVEVSTRNLPVSYANAFLRPARPVGDQTVMDISVKQLGEYMARLATTYNLNAERGYVVTQEYALPGAETLTSLADLQDWLSARLPEA